MTEAMGDGDRRPGVRQHVVGDSADGEGAQGLVCFDLTTPRDDRARQMFSANLVGLTSKEKDDPVDVVNEEIKEEGG